MNRLALMAISLTCFQYTAFAAIPSIEKDALVELYNSSNGMGWTTKTNWLTGDPCSNDWYGVTCDQSAQITQILLSGNNLLGTIPAELGNLSNLEWLWLQNNQLSGSIPAQLGNMVNLERMDLGSNQLSGSIPAAFGNLANLIWLEIDNNQLNEPIPVELGNLAKLRYLLVQNNQLNGLIPAELGNLVNLEWLWLQNNQLSGSIPDQLGNLANLERMDLGNNQLSGSIPAAFGNLANLIWLEIDNNQLNEPIPVELGNLGNLGYLLVQNNQLNGLIPAELGNLANLEWLWLQNNQLSGSIPAQLGNLANLEQMDFGSNQLKGEIPIAIANLSNLANSFGLDLHWNSLHSADAGLNAFLDTKSGSDWSSTQTVAPKNILVKSVSENIVSLSWDAIEYITNSGRYLVSYSSSLSGPYIAGGSTNSKSNTSLAINELALGTTYYFVVQSITDSHVFNQSKLFSEFSDKIVVRTLGEQLIYKNGFED